MKSATQPRISHFMGMKNAPLRHSDGTWLEAESICYPSGGMLRKAKATCPDGKQRVVKCGIADTYFSIPAAVVIKGIYIKGYITRVEVNYKYSFAFRVVNRYKEKFSAVTGHKF